MPYAARHAAITLAKVSMAASAWALTVALPVALIKKEVALSQ